MMLRKNRHMSDTARNSIRKERPLVITILGSYSHMMSSVISALGGATALFIGIFAAIEFAIAWALFSGIKACRIIVITLSIIDLVAHSSTLAIGNLLQALSYVQPNLLWI